MDGDPTGSETPRMHGNTSDANRGGPRHPPAAPPLGRHWSAAGRWTTTYAADARAWAVRQPRSTEEGPEQRQEAGGGGTGGKEAGHAELATGHHAPDTGPGARAGGPGTGTASNRTEERSAIYRAAAPHLRHRHAQGGVSRPET